MQMLKKFMMVAACCACLIASGTFAADRPVVTEVDLSKYAGKNYAIAKANDVAMCRYAGDHTLSAPFEIIRPNLEAFTIGRVYTDSAVLRVAPAQKSFVDGERAIFQVRNVKYTSGKCVRFYVEIVSPVCMTLCFDVYVTSDKCVRQLCGPTYFSHGSIR